MLRFLTHPFGLMLLTGTAAATLMLRIWAPWSDRSWWALGWGLAIYVLATASLVRRSRIPSTTPPVLESPPLPAPVVTERLLSTVTQLEDVISLTEEALRRLRSPAALANCGLVAALPRTLDAAIPRASAHAQDSPLARAQALREALLKAIERLRPAEEDDSSVQSQQYRILHEEYALGRSTRAIMTRLSISESTFHRYRRDAILAVAQELVAKEQGLSSGSSKP